MLIKNIFNKNILNKLSLLKSNFKLRAIIANVGWLLVDRILRMTIGLFVGVWIVRYLGAQQYGLFTYATAFITLFSPFANSGLDNIVIRHLVHNSSEKEQILGTTFCVKFLGGVASSLLTVACISFFRPDDKLIVFLVAILATAGIFQAFDTIDIWFQSQVQSKYTVLTKNAVFIVITLLNIVLIKIQAPLIAFAWLKLAEIFLSAMGLALAYKIKGHLLCLWRCNFALAKTLLRESWALILSGFSIMVYMKTDQIMLGEILGNDAVGIYSAATRISETWYFIPVTIVSSVAPSIYAAKQNCEAVYYQRISQLLRLMVLLSIVIAVPMTFLSGTIINVLFGNGYAEAEKILAIHIWASLFVFMGMATHPWFVAESLTHLSLYRTLIGAITNITLNLFLIPKYAGVGAAIATVISYGFSDFISNLTHPKSRKIFWIQMKSFLPFSSSI
jgi:polysaccharide transporter, PST family